MIHTEILQESIAVLLNKASFSTSILHIEQCQNGKNNRTYRVATKEGVFAVKKYFQQSGDKRDRLASEFAFLTYAKKVVPNRVPTPFSCDAENGLALYEFIDGVSFEKDALSRQDVTQAIDFFCALNEPSARMSAEALPMASEACFTIQAHIDLIGARIHELQNIAPEINQDQIAQVYIQALKSSWSVHIEKIKNRSDLNVALDLSQRCLSPSDFGFHNALRRQDGTICFLDFEYAGWDDPAKMSGDFFAQLAIPVPQNYFDSFVRQVMTVFAEPDELLQRASLLRYLYQVKWCCIALNIFLPTHLARRRFSNPLLDVVEMKNTQLEKVATLIKNLEMFHHDYD